jgi:hypothetical protein
MVKKYFVHILLHPNIVVVGDMLGWYYSSALPFASARCRDCSYRGILRKQMVH